MGNGTLIDVTNYPQIAGTPLDPKVFSPHLLEIGQLGSRIAFWPQVSAKGVASNGTYSGFKSRMDPAYIIVGATDSIALGTQAGLNTMVIGSLAKVPRFNLDVSKGFCIAGIGLAGCGVGANSAVTASSWFIGSDNATGKMQFRIGAYTSSLDAYTGPLVNSATTPRRILFDYDRTAGRARLWVDEALQLDVTDAALAGASLHTQGQIGLINNNAQSRFSHYPEIVVLSGAASTAERASIMGYHADLMGL